MDVVVAVAPALPLTKAGVPLGGTTTAPFRTTACMAPLSAAAAGVFRVIIICGGCLRCCCVIFVGLGRWTLSGRTMKGEDCARRREGSKSRDRGLSCCGTVGVRGVSGRPSLRWAAPRSGMARGPTTWGMEAVRKTVFLEREDSADSVFPGDCVAKGSRAIIMSESPAKSASPGVMGSLGDPKGCGGGGGGGNSLAWSSSRGILGCAFEDDGAAAVGRCCCCWFVATVAGVVVDADATAAFGVVPAAEPEEDTLAMSFWTVAAVEAGRLAEEGVATPAVVSVADTKGV